MSDKRIKLNQSYHLSNTKKTKLDESISIIFSPTSYHLYSQLLIWDDLEDSFIIFTFVCKIYRFIRENFYDEAEKMDLSFLLSQSFVNSKQLTFKLWSAHMYS